MPQIPGVLRDQIENIFREMHSAWGSVYPHDSAKGDKGDTGATGADGAGGAPSTVDYLVGTASGDLSAEIVAGTAPAGELGGTWGSPTVDATHSGSAHHARSHDHSNASDDSSIAPVSVDISTFLRMSGETLITIDGGATPNLDNWDPNSVGATMAGAVFTITNAAVNLRSMVKAGDGHVVFLWNYGATYALTIQHDAGTGTATNKFYLSGAADIVLNQYEGVWLRYEANNGRWSCIGEHRPSAFGTAANDHAESHTVASHSDTTATGAETETLTDGSNADSLHVHEGTAIKSTGEAGGTKFLREDGDGTSSWQTPSGAHGAGDLDQHGDVTLTAEARGDIMRRGATVWENYDVVAVGAGAILTHDGTDVVAVVPKRTLVLTAAGGAPSTTSGCTGPTKNETGATVKDYWSLDFADAADSYAFWNVQMPDNYDGGTITYQVCWTADTAAAGETVYFALDAVSFASDGVLTAAFGSAVSVNDDVITQKAVHYTGTSGAVTIGGGPAGGEYVIFRLMRDGDHASDDLTDPAMVLSVKIIYTTDNASDE